MNTPYFLIHEDMLVENIGAFRTALDTLWPYSEIAYSVKTNSLPWLIKFMIAHGIMAETVSDEEYELAKLCGYSDDRIVFNGPIKGEKQFATAVRGGAIVNLDSESDLNYTMKYCNSDTKGMGIRVNVDTSVFNEEDIGYEADGFRFGFAVENNNFAKAVEIVRTATDNAKLGLHLHCNSITRSVNVYRAIARYAAKLIREYSLEISFIDVGGGFFGGVPGKATPTDYITAIVEELGSTVDRNQVKLIIEPGSAIIGSVVDLYTSVVDAKNTTRARIVTTDGSRIHIDPLWAKNRYMYSLELDEQIERRVSVPSQIICGYTCMDHDRLMTLEQEPELVKGDKIIYHRVGAYSMTFGGMFIRYYPDVYIKTSNAVEKVRNRISVADYYRIQNVIE